MIRKTFTYQTNGRGIYDITKELSKLIRYSEVETGLCHIFCQHTSCSLLLTENYDPDVKHDIETYLADLVTDGDVRFKHQAEGPDDMSAHIRTLLTQSEMTIPITESQLDLGTWQGINLYEHRYQGHTRTLMITISY